MSLLNVAVWGLGKHAINCILPALSVASEIRLVGVCSRNGEVVEDCAEKWDCYGWNNPNDMLNKHEVDVIYIATPIGIHYTCAEQALRAGKHVWCEKPLTCNYEETQPLLSLAENLNRVLTESFMYLHHPQFRRVKRFVEESKHVHSVICRFGIPTMSSPGFRNDPKLCGGALWDVATYTVSALLALFPGQQVEILFSEVLKKEGSPVDSEGRVLLRFSQGATAYLEWGVGVAYKNEVSIWAEDGSFFTDKIFSKPKEYEPLYELRDLNGNRSVEHGDQCEQFDEMFHNFVGMMSNEQEIAAERNVILQRARLMNKIVNFDLIMRE